LGKARWEDCHSDKTLGRKINHFLFYLDCDGGQFGSITRTNGICTNSNRKMIFRQTALIQTTLGQMTIGQMTFRVYLNSWRRSRRHDRFRSSRIASRSHPHHAGGHEGEEEDDQQNSETENESGWR